VVHECQCLALGLEAGDDLFGVHPSLNELQRDHAFDRLGLLGHPHRAHAAFADLLQQLVGADYNARVLGSRWFGRDGNGRFEKVGGTSMLGKEPIDALTPRNISLTRLSKERIPFLQIRSFERFGENGLFVHVCVSCRSAPTAQISAMPVAKLRTLFSNFR
jgi:hypothetical protein